ncbi:unnamed protein product [Ectocarpus sp. 6 AP-2014]
MLAPPPCVGQENCGGGAQPTLRNRLSFTGGMYAGGDALREQGALLARDGASSRLLGPGRMEGAWVLHCRERVCVRFYRLRHAV